MDKFHLPFLSNSTIIENPSFPLGPPNPKADGPMASPAAQSDPQRLPVEEGVPISGQQLVGMCASRQELIIISAFAPWHLNRRGVSVLSVSSPISKSCRKFESGKDALNIPVVDWTPTPRGIRLKSCSHGARIYALSLEGEI